MEWSRIEPSDGVFSEEALSHYAQVIRACRERRLEPIVTLHHFTNPQWFAAEGGWETTRSVERFAGYTETVARRFGGQVRWWVTLNEPTVLVYFGYMRGTWPPGKRSPTAAMAVLNHLMRAHAGAYRILHDFAKDAQVGLANHLRAYDPCRPGFPLDRACVRMRERIGNESVLRRTRDTADFIGVNSYTRDFIRWSWKAPVWGDECRAGNHSGEGTRNSLGWEVYPEGLKRVLLSLKSWGKPILITENGICTQDDAVRARFIEEHVRKMLEAKAEGAPVRGYLYWSLLDNFEWADGFGPRFGLVEVDYATQERRVRPSALRFRDLIVSSHEGVIR